MAGIRICRHFGKLLANRGRSGLRRFPSPVCASVHTAAGTNFVHKTLLSIVYNSSRNKTGFFRQSVDLESKKKKNLPIRARRLPWRRLNSNRYYYYYDYYFMYAQSIKGPPRMLRRRRRRRPIVLAKRGHARFMRLRRQTCRRHSKKPLGDFAEPAP